jgi:plastocyanin
MDRGHQRGRPVNAATPPSAATRRGVLPTGPCRKRTTAVSRRRWMLVPGLLGALVLQACSTETRTADCRPAGIELRIKAGEPTHKFSTDCLAAPANKSLTIRFTNLDESSHGQHNIAIEDVLEGKTIGGSGESITYKIGPQRAGNYEFVCTKHPFMKGTLVVK